MDCIRVHIPVTGLVFWAFCRLTSKDFGTPRIDQALQFVKVVKQALDEGKIVTAHCHAGAGRTGTMLGCYLVSYEGQRPNDAISSLRRQGRVLSNRQQVRA